MANDVSYVDSDDSDVEWPAIVCVLLLTVVDVELAKLSAVDAVVIFPFTWGVRIACDVSRDVTSLWVAVRDVCKDVTSFSTELMAFV